MHRLIRSLRWAVVVSVSVGALGCGDGADDPADPPPFQEFSVGGTVSGLAIGKAVVLKNNGGDSLSVGTSGPFAFPTKLANGASYAVTVVSPAGQTCSVSNGDGTINAAHVANVSVACVTAPILSYSVGGSVSGLGAGKQVVLKNNGGNNLTVTASGSFTFTTKLLSGVAYAVTVGTHPAGQHCTVSSASGSINAANVSNVSVACVDSTVPTYSVGGTLSGLGSGKQAVLKNNGGDNLTIDAIGSFTFPNELANSATYVVTVVSPAGQTCTVSNGSGTIHAADVSTVHVTCITPPTYSVGGSVSGLAAGKSLVLKNNGGDSRNISVIGPFTFPTELIDGADYSVTAISPTGQSCTVSLGTGIIHGNVTNVAVTCVNAVGRAALPAGFLNVNAVSGVFPNDASRDSANGIQTAINQAKVARKTLYFPPNTTYYVSKTLLAVQPYGSAGTCLDPSGSSFRLWGGGRSADRPTIVLMDNSPGFNAGSPKNLIWIGKDGDNDADHLPDARGASCAMGHVFKNINLVLGNNPWAVALSMNAAQRSVLEDVRIDATGGYAGISGVPGRGTSVGNIEIIGGQYGFRFIDYPVGISLYGLKLRGQTQRAIAGFAARSFAIAGFEIEKATGPAIETAGENNRDAGHLGLYDGSIKLTTPGTAILNNSQRILDLRNVYMSQASTLVDNGSDGRVTGDGAHWSTVNEYTYCPTEVATGKACWNLGDGVKSRAPHDSLSIPSSAPPTTLMSRHVWEGSPPVLDAQVIYITDAPFNAIPNDGLSDRTAIQAAIDSTEPGGANAGKSIFVPPGTYNLSGPIVLKAHTHLFGLPTGQSEFKALPSWVNGLTSNAWLFDTVDDAAATTSIEYVWPTWDEPYVSAGMWAGSVRWRVGRNSVMRGVRQLGDGRCEDKPRHMWHVEGNGGGRWYTWMEERAQSEACRTTAHMDPNFRKLYITGTTQPLSIYGPNAEHGGIPTEGGPANPYIEIVNSSNIRFFALKTETNGTMLVIRNSSNIFFSGAHAFNFENYGQPYVRVENSSNISLAMVAAWGSNGTALLTEAGMGASDVVDHDDEIGVYRRGSLNWTGWPASF